MEIEKIQSFSAKYYDHKIKTDLEFYAKEKKRVNEYMKNRYATDEEYRNKIKEQKKQSYHRRKSMMIPNNQVQVY
jgi:hypothetical protein